VRAANYGAASVFAVLYETEKEPEKKEEWSHRCYASLNRATKHNQDGSGARGTHWTTDPEFECLADRAWMLWWKVRYYVLRDDYDKALPIADQLCEAKDRSMSAGKLYDAACAYCRYAASLMPEDGQPLTEEQAQERLAYISKGMQTLKRAVDDGWNKPDHMKQDSDLDVLRELPEFKVLQERSQQNVAEE
jgi:hypothetical protein